MRASVIIPVYNGAETIGLCLEALLRQSVPRGEYEIIVVDDGSTDETREIVKRYDVRLLSQPRRGPAAARNLGASQARGEILLFTDADCEPTQNWVEEMIKPFQNAEVVGVKGIYQTSQRSLVARFAQIEFEDRYELLRRDEYIDFVDSYSAGFRKEAFLKVSGFDPNFPVANNEDVDLSYRIAKRGYKMVFNPKAVADHRHPSTLRDYLKLKFWRAYWRMFVYRRYPEKMVKDSYTPQVLKVQILLIYLAVASLCGSIFIKGARHLFWGLMGLLSISTMPFSLRAGQRDLMIGLIVPFILLLRSFVFSVGVLVGFVASFTRRGKVGQQNNVPGKVARKENGCYLKG